MSEILYDDDGQAVGYLERVEDGSFVVHDGETILAACDANGELIDHTAFELTDDGQAESEAFQAERDAYEAARDQEVDIFGQAMAVRQAERDAEEAQQWASMEKDIRHQAERLQSALGRPLLNSEAQRVAGIVSGQLDRRQPIDVTGAAASVVEQGGLVDTRRPSGKAEWINQRVAEDDQAQRAEEVERHGPELVDLASREGRADAISAAAAGRDDVQIIDSRDDDYL